MTSHIMSPDLLFWLSLALKMAVTAGFVIAAAMVAERAGPAIGAHGRDVADRRRAGLCVRRARPRLRIHFARARIGSIAAHAATAVFSLVYIVLAQRIGMAVSVGGAVAVWFVVAFLLRSVSWTFLTVAAANLAIFGICIALTNRYRHVQMPLIVRKWYDMPVRAFMVACLVAAVVGSSGHVGPTVTGLLAVYPIVMTSLMLIFQPRVGGPRHRGADRQHHVGPGRLQRVPVHGASRRACRSAPGPGSRCRWSSRWCGISCCTWLRRRARVACGARTILSCRAHALFSLSVADDEILLADHLGPGLPSRRG